MNTKKSTLLSIALLSMHLLPITTQASQDTVSLDVDDHKEAGAEITVVNNTQDDKKELYERIFSFLVFGYSSSEQVAPLIDQEKYEKYYRRSQDTLVLSEKFILEKMHDCSKSGNINDLAAYSKGVTDINEAFIIIGKRMLEVNSTAVSLLAGGKPTSNLALDQGMFFDSLIMQIALAPEKIDFTESKKEEKNEKSKSDKILDEIKKLEKIQSACKQIAEAIDYKDCGKLEEEKAKELLETGAKNIVSCMIQPIKSVCRKVYNEFENHKYYDFQTISNRLKISDIDSYELTNIKSNLNQFVKMSNSNAYQYYISLPHEQKSQVAFFTPVKDFPKEISNLATEEAVALGQVKYSLEQKSEQLGILIAAARAFLIKYLLKK